MYATHAAVRLTVLVSGGTKISNDQEEAYHVRRGHFCTAVQGPRDVQPHVVQSQRLDHGRLQDVVKVDTAVL